MEVVEVRSTVVSDEKPLEVLSKHIAHLMSTIGSKSFPKPNSGESTFSKPMKQNGHNQNKNY